MLGNALFGSLACFARWPQLNLHAYTITRGVGHLPSYRLKTFPLTSEAGGQPLVKKYLQLILLAFVSRLGLDLFLLD